MYANDVIPTINDSILTLSTCTYHRVDEEANEMMYTLQQKILETDPIPDQNDFMGAVKHRNMIRSQAEEIVEIVYQLR